MQAHTILSPVTPNGDKMSIPFPRTYSPKEAANIVGIPFGTMAAWRSRGDIEKEWRYTVEGLCSLHLLRWLTETMGLRLEVATSIARQVQENGDWALVHRNQPKRTFLYASPQTSDRTGPWDFSISTKMPITLPVMPSVIVDLSVIDRLIHERLAEIEAVSQVRRQ